jgi:predicted CopG family antitoxin
MKKKEESKLLTLQVDQELYNKLVAEAKKEDRSISSYIRLLIKKQLENK